MESIRDQPKPIRSRQGRAPGQVRQKGMILAWLRYLRTLQNTSNTTLKYKVTLALIVFGFTPCQPALSTKINAISCALWEELHYSLSIKDFARITWITLKTKKI